MFKQPCHMGKDSVLSLGRIASQRGNLCQHPVPIHIPWAGKLKRQQGKQYRGLQSKQDILGKTHPGEDDGVTTAISL